MSEKKKSSKTSTKKVEKKEITKEIKQEKPIVEEKEVKNATETKEAITFENDSKTRRIVKRVWNIVFWTLFICLFAVWIIDFINVKRDKDPMFCLSEKTHEYEDGTTKECVGLGYKVYNYDRKSINIKSQFTPFFVGMEE